MPNTEIDCQGLSCPMPIVKVAKAIKKMAAGDSLQVVANDPAFKADLEAWCKKLGHQLHSFEDGPTQTAVVVKS